MIDDSADTLLIFERLREFSEAYARKDIAGVVATFAHGSTTPVVVAGDSALPLIGTRALCQRLVQEFSTQLEFRLRTQGMEFDINDDVAWVAVWSEAIVPGQQQPSPTRFTAILKKEAKGWFISQLHFSVPLSPSSDLREAPILHPQRHRATFLPIGSSPGTHERNS